MQIEPGLSGSVEITVGEQHTAPSIGSGKVRVLATPVMINLIEAAALKAIEHLLQPGYQSLGTHLDVHHVAATGGNESARHRRGHQGWPDRHFKVEPAMRKISSATARTSAWW